MPTLLEIEEVLIPLGFKKESEDTFPRYLWFEEKNIASLRGCWLSWFDGKGKEFPRGTLTVFVAKTYAGRVRLAASDTKNNPVLKEFDLLSFDKNVIIAEHSASSQTIRS